MFDPFADATDFYPGLIVWCDPSCYEPDSPGLSIPDRRKSRELRPCLVISVNHNDRSFQAARFSATTPPDPSRWVRIDSPPPITWKLNAAWIYVAAPPTIAMVFNNAKIMHPNKDTYYSTNPVATTNLSNYWVHRQAYINSHMRAPSVRHSTKSIYQDRSNNNTYCGEPPAASPIHASFQNRHSPPKYQQQAPTYASPNFNQAAAGIPYLQPQGYQQLQSAAAFNSLSPHPVVVPPGFTETRQDSPGWWRNPTTGWFWHASRGLLPPSPPR
ncbi:hypothetical protein MVEN_00793300 [Mycena venus]|uniref:Uncharacterized protein n=1 Tax=Mycena venus TaxID=2733690 RepID=A0A8H6YKZ7_9AGAR|nr:hypothetical protein MVEN_00793300 [Mycena venus]